MQNGFIAKGAAQTGVVFFKVEQADERTTDKKKYKWMIFKYCFWKSGLFLPGNTGLQIGNTCVLVGFKVFGGKNPCSH